MLLLPTFVSPMMRIFATSSLIRDIEVSVLVMSLLDKFYIV